MKIRLFIPIFFFALSAFAQKHPFTFEDMMKLKRVDEPVPSPDGKWVVFSATDVDLEANTKISHLWVVPANGGGSKRLNETMNHEERPRFSPDGKKLIWTSKATDPTQIWMCDFDSNAGTLAGKPHQVTNISTGADGAIWSPDGKNIVFVSVVYPDCKDDSCNKQRDEELKKSKVKAKIFTKLFYRHWNAFTEFKRSHLFVIPADSSVEAGVSPAGVQPGTAATTEEKNQPRDLTPGDHDVPLFHLGGQDMYAISPDGQEVAYTSNIDEVEATSTNSEIFTVPISVGDAVSVSGKPTASPTAKKISTSPGADTTPLYSPDGKYLAWKSQARAGFESDKWRLLVQDRQSGKTRDVMEIYPQSVASFTWKADPQLIYFVAGDHGGSIVGWAAPDGSGFNVQPDFLWSGVGQFTSPFHADDLIAGKDSVYFSRNGVASSSEIWRALTPVGPSIDTLRMQRLPATEPVTHMNDALLSQIDMQPLESFTFKGANDEEVQGFMVKPPEFNPNKEYPLKFLIHGGPQGAWGNSWTYRWNAELFAASGYVVVMINFHGSTGYGQKFTDSISGDWGGKPYVDLMKGSITWRRHSRLSTKTARRRSARAMAVTWPTGCSATPTDSNALSRTTECSTPRRRSARLRNCGSRIGNSKVRRGNSASFTGNGHRTSMPQISKRQPWSCTASSITVLDVSNGFDLFTTLQTLKVPSKMLYFPDEGHWVLKPQNSRLWYKTVNDSVVRSEPDWPLTEERCSDAYAPASAA